MNLKNRIAQTQADVVPADFYTAEQWCKRLDSSLTQTSLTLRRGMRMGIVVCQKYRIVTSRGLYPTPHYKELPDDTETTAQTQGTSDGDRKHCDSVKPSNGQGFTRRQNAGREAKAFRGA